MGWPIVPWGFRELLLYMHARYAPSHGIIVTENGCAYEPPGSAKYDRTTEGALVPVAASGIAVPSSTEVVNDPSRVRYLRAHLAAVHAARERGADVRGYFVWSFLDNFEWSYGYEKRFGIV